MRAKELKVLGYRVTVVSESVRRWIGFLGDLAPDAVVLDLDRLPSHGREVGLHLRASKTARYLPLVYLGGLAEKTERVRRELPDAKYADWSEAGAAIEEAVTSPPDRSARPAQRAGTSKDSDLAKRLGIRAGMRVVTWGDTDFLLELLGEMPDTVAVSNRLAGTKADGAVLWLCVARTAAELEEALDRLTLEPGSRAGASESAAVKTAGWIIHPKQGSRLHTDFNQNDVRASGLARGWVDSKVCSVDADWSALRFTKRKVEAGVRPIRPMMGAGRKKRSVDA